MITHQPVLLEKALEFLSIKKGSLYIDATLGGGGHGVEILRLGGKLLGIDLDNESLKLTKQRMENGGWKIDDKDLVLAQGNFRDIGKIAQDYGFFPADGILFDLGISSMQLAREKGFSFEKDAVLDMRLDPENQGVTAADLLNSLREDQLIELFSQTDSSSVARVVSRAIIDARQEKKFERTSELVDLVNRVYRGRLRKISPATTIFLALRMAVNSELENLTAGLTGAYQILGTGGRLAVISFHSGEDRIVKNFLREKENVGQIAILTPKPVLPTKEEIMANPRSRSAKLRVGEKTI